MHRLLTILCLSALVVGTSEANAQSPLASQAPATPVAAPRPPRPVPPKRDPDTPGYVAAKELPDGANAQSNADGNFIIGPTHTAA